MKEMDLYYPVKVATKREDSNMGRTAGSLTLNVIQDGFTEDNEQRNRWLAPSASSAGAEPWRTTLFMQVPCGTLEKEAM